MQPGELPTIIDAFTLNPAIRNRPGYYMASALASMDVLRRANTYRPKWYVVPDEEHAILPRYQTLQYQVRVTPRSYIWGMLLNQYAVAIPQAITNADDVWCQITDTCNGIPFFSDFVRKLCREIRRVAPARGVQLPPLILGNEKALLEPVKELARRARRVPGLGTPEPGFELGGKAHRDARPQTRRAEHLVQNVTAEARFSAGSRRIVFVHILVGLPPDESLAEGRWRIVLDLHGFDQPCGELAEHRP